MAIGTQLRILLVSDPPLTDIRAALEAVGINVVPSGLSGIDPQEVAKSNAVVISVPKRVLNSAQALCRRWRIELGEQFVPFIWLADNEVTPNAGLDAGADVVLPASSPADQLIAQLKALLRIQHLHGRLVNRAAEAQHLNQRLHEALRQIDADRDLTRRIHRGFLPRNVPDVGRFRFGVCYRPRGRTGGDFYDVVRLDEDHLAIYLADSMGRGLQSSGLLGIFVRRAISPKVVVGKSYQIVPPGEVLNRLNSDLLNLALPEPPFVTLCYLQLGALDGTVTMARAAHPAPLHVPRDDDPQYWQVSGTLLGVFDAEYPVLQKQLAPGDKLLLYSDGVHPPSISPGGMNDPLIEAVQRHRGLAAQPFVDALARDLVDDSRQPEDCTLVAIEMLPE